MKKAIYTQKNMLYYTYNHSGKEGYRGKGRYCAKAEKAHGVFIRVGGGV